jgi:enoyl-CoA hydratase/carnithine racemase
MNRPAQLNAMSRQLSAELHDAVTRMSADDEVGCIVVTGAGERAFSAGGDIHEQGEDDRKYTREELDARGAARVRDGYEIAACPKPTIGMMNGLAYGGASVLASSLDMRIGCEHAPVELPAHRVELRGPIHGDDRDALGLLDEDIVRHRGPPIPRAGAQRSNT